MSVKGEALAKGALIDWLRWNMPAKVAEVNAARPAVLKASTPGPYTVTGMGLFQISLTARDSGGTQFTSTSGSRTATQVAASINANVAGIASVDADDRLVLTSTTNPTSSNSGIFLQPASNNTYAAFGWDPGGMHVLHPPLVFSGHKAVFDGWPLAPDAGGQSMMIIIGDRVGNPVPGGPRRDEHVCGLEVHVWRPITSGEVHRTREAIHAAVQCVRECVISDTGLSLGNQVLLVEEGPCRVRGAAAQVTEGGKTVGPLFDTAVLTLKVRVYERPPSS